MGLSKNCVSRALTLRCFCRRYSQKPAPAKSKNLEKEDASRIRNIGILAHIDAGKTTTTERMLFYSGTISHMGEVHHGNTVTDFMDQERKRGITITSASVTFNWNKHKINLLDTPGHIDFTMEVEQTLSVMDGAVIILDGSAGVEAQTITVWKQADKYKIPRIIYVNKMDRIDACLASSVKSIHKKFNVTPVVLQLPILNESKHFKGVVDLLTMEKCLWKSSDMGVNYSQTNLTSEDGNLWENALKARMKLAETLADLDDKMAEIIIADEKKLETVSATALRESVRKISLEQKGIPVLCGSSFKNIGVQLLMNGIVYYLPSPVCNNNAKLMQCFNNNLCARAFKVRHDEHKGAVTFFRIYSGSISKGQKIYNVRKEKTEQTGKVYMPYADDYEEVPSIGVGNVAAVTGLKLTSAGELVTSSSTSLSSAKKVASSKKDLFKSVNLDELFSSGATIPDPVFFCSIEASSPSQQAGLEKALAELEREDPSLRVSISPDTGQTVLGGMGELHLEVIKERIRKDYNLDAYLGPLQIAYKETLIESAKDSFFVQHRIGSSTHAVKLTLSVLISDSDDKEKLLLDRSPECSENISTIYPKHLLAVKNGVESALSCGPKLLCPVTNVNVMLHYLEVHRGTSESVISSATAQSIKKLLIKGGTKLQEPIMLVEVVCNEKMMESVMNDLSRRRVQFDKTDTRGLDIVIRAFVPLSELLGYATGLRVLTSGTASFTMEFHSFRDMTSEEEAKAIKSVTGF